ncbi:sodium-dependent glucose transporter 1A-like [Anneissia japonica]|uniref:sodium-dependent glucose transporter 1A-like n=1 Tax=Anneissia japonica TaxID=1529436 RepID=UPI0014258777|nr:sodium-dependent glucose transporter 1A-like [Anneissia japonica]XP_033105266.1 sodium-dependent glucose transporter 1A-like [Anneissia japonica]
MSDDEDVLFDVGNKNFSNVGLINKKAKNVTDVLVAQEEDRRLKKTIFLCGAFASVGLCISVLGPTIRFLEIQTNSDPSHLSYVFLGRGFGYVLGSIQTGCLFEVLNPLTYLGISLATCAVSMSLVPSAPDVGMLMFLFVFIGITMGSLDTGANVLCLQLWGKRSPPFMQALHFSFAVGALVAPLLAKPYFDSALSTPNVNIRVKYSDEVNVTYTNITTPPVSSSVVISSISAEVSEAPTNTTTPLVTSTVVIPSASVKVSENPTSTAAPLTSTQVTEASNITTSLPHFTDCGNETNCTAEDAIPPRGSNQTYDSRKIAYTYYIIAVFVAINSFAFFYFSLTSPKKMKPSLLQKSLHASDNIVCSHFNMQMLSIMFLFYFLYVGAEVAFGSFIFSYAVDSDVQMNEEDASMLNSVFWISFAMSRGFAICCAGYIPPFYILLADMVGCLIASFSLVFFGNTNPQVLWFGTIFLGASMASLFPTGLSWLERYLKVSGKAATFLVLGAASGEMVIPFLVGQYFSDDDDDNGQESSEINLNMLMYMILVVSVILPCLFFFANRIAENKGDRYTKKNRSDRETLVTHEIVEAVIEAAHNQKNSTNGKKFLRSKKHKE